MTDIRSVKVSGDKTMETLQTFCRQQEEIKGPMTMIGAGKDLAGVKWSLLSFDLDGSRPTRPIVLVEVHADDKSPKLVGHSLVCVGSAYISTALKKVAAFRPL